MQTPTLHHVPEAAHEALLDGVHRVETFAAAAVQQLAPVADRALDVVLAPVALDFSHVSFDDLDLDADALA